FHFALPLLTLAFVLHASVVARAELRVEISPREATLQGRIDRLQITVGRWDGETLVADLTREAAYESLASDVATVDNVGLVKPLADGTTTVRAHLDGQTFDMAVQVTGVDSQPPSFDHDVIPILARTGCSTGACHASQYGKGDFKLSLLGFAPEQDHAPIVRERSQRRVSAVDPSASLILTKPTLEVAHGGGRRFVRDSYEYNLLLEWVRSGMPGPQKDAAKVVDLLVEPPTRVYRSGETQQLRVTAVFSDGRRQDVTQRAIYDSMSEAVVSVTPSGLMKAEDSGQAPVMVRYLGQAKISLVVVPFTGADPAELASYTPNNFIDELALKKWRQLGLSPAPLCSDETFVRRVFLDALGTLPPPQRVEQFLTSTEADKREQLVDEVLGLTGDPNRDVWVNEWSAYWALKWGDLIRNNRNDLGDGGMWSMYNWTRAALRENKPVDRFVRELITAEGSVFESGPANYYKIATKADDLAEATAQVFLGVRLQCAKCHHHPFEVYSQEDYYSLAAFFTRVTTKASSDFGALGGDTVVMIRRSGDIRHPRTGQTMTPTPLMGEPIDPAQVRDLRRPLAEWLTSPDNDLFARNLANRFWSYYLGAGLVEPVDDMRATNPATNPELLDALAEYFVEQRFDLRQLMRAIMTSRVYQLSSTPHPQNPTAGRFYTHYNVKRLPAEVLLDAIDFACGTQEKFTGIPLGTRAIELPDPNFTSYFLDTMGRPQRVITCECERTTDPNLAQVLHIANGDVLSRKISDAKGHVAELLTREMSDEPAIRDLYLRTFSRPPTADEQSIAQETIAAATNRREGFEDLLWALCNSREFLFNH
ncbi:MAG: DUF1553 domain-containing protein, partial [Planctomycetales bacterium]|nr:DUF1553 domain-containing protein [Planctomycetales bacterium]